MHSNPRVVRANVPGASYDIVVQPGLIQSAGEQVRALSNSKNVALVSDSEVGPIYAKGVESSLQATGFQVIRASVSAGEEYKTIATVASIYDQLLEAGIERSTPVIALGGGVVGDMGGFAAATILRGVPLIQMPTTLLSMVDASVGGKTGVNHLVGKNLIGSFHQPLTVLIDPGTLRTLPNRDLRSGLAECIKHEIIRDADGFASLEKNIRRAISLDLDYLSELIAHNVAIKARVVEADPFEKGERAHLNFGHTFGHAIETVSKYEYAHGECVALGMVAASRAAAEMGMLDEGSVERIIRLIAAAGLPIAGMKLPVDEVIAAMSFDKKVKAGRIRFVLPTRIGAVVMRDDVPPEVVHRAVDGLR
jgi:3-dehydroquinate synthase